MKSLPPLPESAYDGEKAVATLPSTRCIHDFTLKGSDISCRLCHSGWPGLAKFVAISEGKLTVKI